jgi:uncharacterized protein (DUF2235 family)
MASCRHRPSFPDYSTSSGKKQFCTMVADKSSRAPTTMKKRLIVCCDGTWQSSNQGTRSVPSNIAKISRAVSVNSVETDGSWCPQIVYYDAGVGTAMGWLDKTVSGMSLYSMDSHNPSTILAQSPCCNSPLFSFFFFFYFLFFPFFFFLLPVPLY